MTHRILLAAFGAATLAVAACVPSADQAGALGDPSEWDVLWIEGQRLPEGTDATLSLAQGQIVYRGGCNSFTGLRYDPAAGTIRAEGPLTSTRMACPAAQMALDESLGAALQRVNGLGRAADRNPGALALLSDGEPVVMIAPRVRQ
ncbi:MAG: META domain-containing protein [Paracoccus sp. (in: a-proteobacteria)]|nr:META domain-containing protein [Paracoccus sp. (in: a-proteobacteria)]